MHHPFIGYNLKKAMAGSKESIPHGNNFKQTEIYIPCTLDGNYFILLMYLQTLLYFHLNQFALLTKSSPVPIIISTFLPSSNSASPVYINNYDECPSPDALMNSVYRDLSCAPAPSSGEGGGGFPTQRPPVGTCRLGRKGWGARERTEGSWEREEERKLLATHSGGSGGGPPCPVQPSPRVLSW